MSFSLTRLNIGDTNYVGKHNANLDAIESAIDGLLAIAAVSGDAMMPGLVKALFGTSTAIIGSTSYAASISGTNVQVTSGYAYLANAATVRRSTSTVTVAFSGQTAGTYYIAVDNTGAPIRSTSSTDALWSVVWSGSVLSALTRLASIQWGGADWIGAQTSTVLGAAYDTLDARLEAGESTAKTHIARIDNPHAVTKAQVGLGDADNTADADKPVSMAQADAISAAVAAHEAAADPHPQYRSYGLFVKADPTTVAFSKTGSGTVSIKAGTEINVSGTLVTFASDTAITMPALTAGTDYAIWVKDDATIQASSSFTSAPGAGNWRKIGGFHYAPGGNASARAGGDATPAINEYSLWDVKFRPACTDPRGMTLVAGSFWADIYLLGVNHLTNGTSAYNVIIADGASPPKIPTKFGGDGSTAYGNLTWWVANEVLQSYGKRSPTYDEFAALAYGTTEATSSGGSDTPTTGVNSTGATSSWNVFTSKWGCVQASGCLWVWGRNNGGGTGASSWFANTEGRGSTYQLENAVRFGGAWGNGTVAGSRCSSWGDAPTFSYANIGARGVADHLVID